RAAVLARLGALVETLAVTADERVVETVRALLDSPRAALRREAALCAGHLQDAASAPRLLELLAQGERGERDAALWALRRISTLGFTADPRPWRLWLDEEHAWWRTRAAACLEELNHPRTEVALAALDEVARRRLHRDVLAAAVVDMGGVAGELALRRCHVLRALASRAGLGFLRECLGQSDADLRRAAEQAWRASTELPPPIAVDRTSRPN
ncbi:MAG TPA: HEAT repeat domain-containing protein, partial [Planctomycetota bacterium]|nr:HEAT repeat domain-containing protein [Planctomycetota bacterium]